MSSLIGNGPQQVPTNGDLGTMAFQDAESVRVTNISVNKLQVTGGIEAGNYKLSALNTAPASATDTGTLGEIRVNTTHIYVCTATNTWVRAALSTW